MKLFRATKDFIQPILFSNRKKLSDSFSNKPYGTLYAVLYSLFALFGISAVIISHQPIQKVLVLAVFCTAITVTLIMPFEVVKKLSEFDFFVRLSHLTGKAIRSKIVIYILWLVLFRNNSFFEYYISSFDGLTLIQSVALASMILLLIVYWTSAITFTLYSLYFMIRVYKNLALDIINMFREKRFIEPTEGKDLLRFVGGFAKVLSLFLMMGMTNTMAHTIANSGVFA